MQSTFISLPQDVLLHIYSFLPHHTLTTLAVVSKRFGALAETQIWTDIEFHQGGYHESTAELKNPPPVVAPYSRRYHNREQCTRWQSPYWNGQRSKASSFFTMLEVIARQDLEHAKELGSRVRTLCTVLDWMNHPTWATEFVKLEYTWNIFPLFLSLTRLELHGVWEPSKDGHGRSFDMHAPPLSQLRYLKLFGYFPQGFMRYTLRSAPTLERLELGVLNAPVGYNSADDRRNPPPSWKPATERNSDDNTDLYNDKDDTDIFNIGEIAPRPMPLFPTARCLRFRNSDTFIYASRPCAMKIILCAGCGR